MFTVYGLRAKASMLGRAEAELLRDKINDAFDLMHSGESIRSVVVY